MSGYQSSGTPLWVKILIIILLMPVFSTPALVSTLPPDHQEWRSIIWGYPFYLILSGWLAWKSYPARPAVAWILMILMVMSSAAIWMLVNM